MLQTFAGAGKVDPTNVGWFNSGEANREDMKCRNS
jgi:hypothetical protein